MNILVSQDFNKLVELLNSQTKDDYPYVMDYFFKTDQIDSNSYCLFGWEDNNIVATYAYRKLSFKDYMVYWSNVFSKFNGENFNPSIPGINQWYSSCQWVHKDYRNKFKTSYRDWYHIGLYDVFDYALDSSINYKKISNNVDYISYNYEGRI